jgi:hypothetical protein
VSENKTVPTEKSVQAFLDSVEDDQKREDSWTLVQLMQEVTGLPAQMWGDAIIGFGKVHYKYASGREGDMVLVGFSPRKQNLALYNLSGSDEFETLLGKLGKYKRGKGCLYLSRLKDVDVGTLKEMVQRAVEHSRQVNPS